MTSEGLDLAVMDRISEILVVLSEVTSSTFYSRLPELDDEDPWHVLYRAINEMVDTLAEAHAKADEYQKELQLRLETVEQQRIAIRELATPVIEVWNGILCLPIVGVMDTTRSSEMTETLLSAIVERKARCTIIDVTGIEVMDTGTVDHFLQAAKAVRLLGAECILTGISPSIAQTIVHMGVDLTGITTFRTLRDALARQVAADGGSRRAAGAPRNGMSHYSAQGK